MEWRAFKKTLHKYRGHSGSVEDIMEELLTEGNLLPHIKVLYQIKAIITPLGHLLQPPPEQVSNGLKGKKIAYKFEIEWEVGTFKCMHKGENSKYKGENSKYRNCTMYLDLELSKYGMGADWVIIKKSN